MKKFIIEVHTAKQDLNAYNFYSVEVRCLQIDIVLPEALRCENEVYFYSLKS